MTLSNTDMLLADAPLKETPARVDQQFLQDVLQGLRQTRKQLPCKYFYDERGSILFTEICNTPEYYITRTELALLDDILPEVTRLIGANANIIEYGSGEGRKIRHLLSALDRPKSYTPVDISAEILLRSTKQLKREFPDLAIHPVVGDYTSDIELPGSLAKDLHSRRVVFFPGSTISNFSEEEARQFLRGLCALLKTGDGLLLGVDLLKSPTRLHQAYNDEEGVTADFNLNLLRRINMELNADFNRHQFEHYAFFNPDQSRIEMHLVSLCDQRVTVGGQAFHFTLGETIHTENSYKYSLAQVARLGGTCGFEHVRAWTDRNDLFSIHYLTKK
jgi:dimethylhistidine N-methyltransferase